MDSDFKVPSAVPQDLLLIQDIIGTHSPPSISKKSTLDSSDDSIASTDAEAESEDEVEAGLALCDDNSGMSAHASDSVSSLDSELDASSSSDSDEGPGYAAPQRQRPPDGVEDEESGVTTATTYLQTRNEIVDADIMVPTISEVEPCDTLEKVGEVMSIVGNIVIVKGHPVDHANSLSERALDTESLLVFEDRKVLGYVYETFGPTSQPLYQVKFNEHYPLDTDKVRLSREVFHVPQQSHFVFVEQLKRLRGSDASNIHDEEPAEDEIDFSDDEKEAAFRAQRNKGRGRSVSSRHSTPALSRIHVDDMVQDTYHSANPYDAHGPYDDDYHVTGPSRPPPVPYDDPYADVPTSDVHVQPVEMNGGSGGEPNCEIGGDGSRMSRGRIFNQGTRGRGVRGHELWSTSRRGYRHNRVTSRRTFNPDSAQSFPVVPRMVECATGYAETENAIPPHPLAQPSVNAWPFPETNSVQGHGQPFIQPHINPRFASMFGFNLQSSSGSMVPWAFQNHQDLMFSPHRWVDTRTMHSSAGSEGEEDTYRPM